jgi:hypothetical protein
MNPPNRPPATPTWGHIKLAEFVERKPGFLPATGYHIYCELRPVADFEAADDDEAADYVAVVEDYVRMGEEAARTYGLALLELQGRVLHFFREGEANEANTNEVIDFAHEFTQSAYSELRDDMKDCWRGFATAFDHGQCILINEKSQHTTSTVSLGPCANRPAKRLFSPSPAGCVSAPSRLVRHLQNASGEWIDLVLKDRKQSPTKTQLLTEKFASLRQLVKKGDGSLTNFSAKANENILNWTPDNPLRMVGAVVRCDLDGFTKLVEKAFIEGEQQVALVASGFRDVMVYAEMVAAAHQPCLMLPWAGDCIAFLLPEVSDPNQRIPRWLTFCMDWLAGEIHGSKSPLSTNPSMAGTKWGIGAARGDTGNLVVAPTVVQAQRFMIAAGWPYATARLAQESATANQVAIETEDHQRLVGAAKSMFDEKNVDDYWVATSPSREGLGQRASQMGQAANQPLITTASKTTITPPPQHRPYYPSNG